ncbi:MAG: hypothetical protein J6B98_03840 [Bacilli bacterium]|nr:hypothetical protein [Bacilli bacterium]
MECNGYNSSKFRYFKLINDKENYSSCFLSFPHLKRDMIFKIPEDSLYVNIFSRTFKSNIKNHINKIDIKRISNDESFDVIKFLTLQDPLIIIDDYQTEFSFEQGFFCIIDPWLKEKMKDTSLYQRTWFSDPKSLAQRNIEIFNLVDDDERLSKETIKSKALALWNNNGLANSSEVEFYKFKTNTPIHFNLKKGEVLNLSNPVIALALIDQDYLKLLANSEEILGVEKENYFIEEFKDFVPGTLRKYYKLKDNIKINEIYDINSEFRLNNFDCGYSSFLAGGYGRINFYQYNDANYNDDGTIAYFYVDYGASVSDSIVENEILKIADCLPQDEAIIRYNMDIEAKKRRKLELEALEYVKNHKAKYYKGTNRLLTPVEFMLQEEAKERKSLGMRLVRTLNKRINDIQ